MKAIDDAYQEGFFRVERRLREINDELERRGGKAEPAQLFMKLNRMTKQGKLFKTKMEGGYRFIQRGS